MTHVSATRIPEATDPELIVDTLVGVESEARATGRGNNHNPPQQPTPSPAGYVLVAELRPELETTLQGVARELSRRRLFNRTLLIGIDQHRETLEEMLDIYDTTIIVDQHKEELIDDLIEFLPALFDNWEALGTCGSLQIPKVDVSGLDPRRSGPTIARELRLRKTPTLHQLAEVDYPDFYAVKAPGDYVSIAVDALNEQATVIDIQGANQSTITVAGFIFDEIDEDLDERLEAMQRERQPDGDTVPAVGDGDELEDNGHGGIDQDIDSVVYREFQTQ
jgi:hypothetical protein